MGRQRQELSDVVPDHALKLRLKDDGLSEFSEYVVTYRQLKFRFHDAQAA
jgi:hypothetical protein